MTHDCCGRAQTALGGAILGQVVLGCTGKEADPARGRKPVSNILLWSLFSFLPPGPALIPALASHVMDYGV